MYNIQENWFQVKEKLLEDNIEHLRSSLYRKVAIKKVNRALGTYRITQQQQNTHFRLSHVRNPILVSKCYLTY